MNYARVATSEEWQKVFPMMRVTDADGWDRRNFDYSWYKELLTRDQYSRRVAGSTCQGHVQAFLDALAADETSERDQIDLMTQ